MFLQWHCDGKLFEMDHRGTMIDEVYGDSGTKPGTSRPSMWSLCKRRGRHVTRSFLSPSRFPLWMVQVPNFDDEPRGPTAISPLQVGPLIASSPPDAPLIFDREALRAPAHQLCRPKYTSQSAVGKPTFNSTRAPTSSLPTRAPHTVSTEHDRDSQRL